MSLRCLIVDDSDAFLEAARVVLEQEGIRVVATASTGAQAARLAEELQPDVVLVDVRLGDESGFEVTEQLTGGDADGAPSVILISTHTEADVAELVAASPAVGFLAKAELSVRAIRDLLNGRRAV